MAEITAPRVSSHVAAAPRRIPGQMRARVQHGLAWTGPVMLVLWVGSFIVLAGFIPPPSPDRTATQVLAKYAGHTDSIRLGLMITLFASALLVPYSAAISAQMRRIEGAGAPLAATQLCSAALLSVEFIVPIMVWQTAAFRFDTQSARMIQMLNDMGWLMFVAVISSVIVQILALAVAILTDERDEPVFPRWAGYFNLWIAISFLSGLCVYFFDSGPFAWRGIFPWWIPLSFFGVWFVVMTTLLLKAIDAQAAAENGQPALLLEEPGSLAHGRA